MKRIDLNGVWTMTGGGYCCDGTVPGSVYSFLLDAKLMEDPFYRDNEDRALALMEHDYTFTRTFAHTLTTHKVLLCCEGLDTLATITLNGATVASTQNMHRRYEFDVTDLLKDGENTISIRFASPTKYAKKMHAEDPVPGAVSFPYQGFYHLRKAHSMFGWDWGPRLPDAGIWRDIYLLIQDSVRILDAHVTQRHCDGKVYLTPTVETSAPCAVSVTLTAPDGTLTTLSCDRETEVANPRLWWPNGLGDQPLYTVTFQVEGDTVTRRIGLRTLELVRQPDEQGVGLYHRVNGVSYFAMGANMIPQDNILSRITPSRTRHLLRQAKDCHFNTIRVWGGGYYPDNWFYDICDEMGLVVFQDMMWACCTPPDNELMRREMAAEVRDNLLRLRHHASLGVIAGNNEVEDQLAGSKAPLPQNLLDMYRYIFENLIPGLVQELCPEVGYLPSSPTSGGGFSEPNSKALLDSHYWAVWHTGKPYKEYRKYLFRYMSEFGFQSFPCEKTIASFALPEEMNPFSRIMERHQRRPSDNGKVLSYLSQTFLYPTNLQVLPYASQVMQAMAMAECVTHLRRNRGICMGALYWQYNDIWPGTSWSGIDYFGRYKVLQYAAKRFYRPIMISCEEVGETDTRKDVNLQKDIYDFETTARLYVHNETRSSIHATVYWQLCSADSTVLQAGQQKVSVPAMSVYRLEEMDFQKTDVLQNHLSYALEMDGKTVSEGSVLFTAPKHYAYKDPRLSFTIRGDQLTVTSQAFAQFVQIDSPDSDFILSDNCFCMEKGSKTVKILEGTPGTVTLRSVFDIR